MKERVTSIQVSENKEVAVEELLAKLAIVTELIRLQSLAEQGAEACNSTAMPLDPLALNAVLGNLHHVSHALKCACYGYDSKMLI
jgi:hypothetical protein